jgi:early secretory antigenic target protein ESAT-6
MGSVGRTDKRRGTGVVGSGEIAVNVDDIVGGADRVRAVAANVELLLGDLGAMLRPIAAEWTGAAAISYQYQQRLWQAAAEDLHSVLLQIAAVLEKTHTSYSEAESGLHRIWGA